MSKELSYLEGLIKGEYLVDEIDDFVDQWNDSDDNVQSLREYLGMTELEYNFWVTKGDNSLKIIIAAREQGLELKEFLNDSSGMTWAARSNSPEASHKISTWISKRESKNE